jgi:hypothetical protein
MISRLAKLEASFIWESRSVVIAAVLGILGTVLPGGSKHIWWLNMFTVLLFLVMVSSWDFRILFCFGGRGIVVGAKCKLFSIHYETGLLPLLLQDGTFSIVVTSIFLAPILKVMDGASAEVQVQSEGYALMRKRVQNTLLGSTLAVTSSTALYINAMVFFTDSSYYRSSMWLNILVFGVNLDSTLNDLAMLLVSGMLRDVTLATFQRRFPAWLLKKSPAINAPAEPTFNFDSSAYD